MMNRKAARRARRARRIALTVALMALVAVLSIGGTIAWLISTPAAITNTFTVGDVNITLEETKGTGTATAKNFPMVPGNTIDKDPTVKVEANSEACYVYVKVEPSANAATYLTYSVDSAWTQLKDDSNNDVTGVYYINVSAADAKTGKSYPVLTESKVTVNTNVTEAQLEDAEGSGAPTLTFTAYAIQSANTGSEYQAWTKLQDELNP